MQVGVLEWNLKELSNQLHLTQEDTLQYFRDGRRCSFIVERRIAKEILNGSIAESEGASYDVFDSSGLKWEVRSLTKQGVYFCPSYMVGSGRSFQETGFLDKLDEISGYYLARITTFPIIPVFKIETDQVRHWYKRGALGVNTKITYSKAEQLLESIS